MFPSNIEPEPRDLTVGVALHGVTKMYGSKIAVNNLNLNFYEGHITSLLGPNGAGKTTTMYVPFQYSLSQKTKYQRTLLNLDIFKYTNLFYKKWLLQKVPRWSKLAQLAYYGVESKSEVLNCASEVRPIG